MPNPYFLLAGLVFALGLFASGVSVGYRWESRAHAAAVLAAQNEAIDRANRDTDAAVALAVEQAKREADARVRAAGFRRKGEIDAAAKARPDCGRDTDSMRLLNESIAAANGTTPAGNSLPDAVRPAPNSGVGQ